METNRGNRKGTYGNSTNLSFFLSAFSSLLTEKSPNYVLPRFPSSFSIVHTASQWRKYQKGKRFWDINPHGKNARSLRVTASPYVRRSGQTWGVFDCTANNRKFAVGVGWCASNRTETSETDRKFPLQTVEAHF